MTEKEFNLSEKIWETLDDKLEVIGVWHVREFIRRLKEEMQKPNAKVFEIIDKLAGKELVK